MNTAQTEEDYMGMVMEISSEYSESNYDLVVLDQIDSGPEKII